MLFNQAGRIVEYQPEGSWVAKKESFLSAGELTFLLRFIWDRDAVKIMTSDMKLITLTDEDKIVMVHKDDPCGSTKEDVGILQLACESRGDCAHTERNSLFSQVKFISSQLPIIMIGGS